MRVLVSGASGVVGRRAVPLMISRGHSVTALVRSPSSRTALERAGARCKEADLFDLEALRRVAAGHHAIINLATHMPATVWKMLLRSSWRENDRLRTEGVANLVEAASTAGVARLIQESFAFTYPDRGDAWIDEDTPLEPVDYNRTVLDAERSVAGFCDRGGTGVVLRFAAFYGPDAMQVQSYIDGLRKGWVPLPGRPDGYVSSISHDDAATAVVAALGAPAGAYTVGDNEPVTRAVYFGSLANELRLGPPRFLPQWAPVLFGSVGRLMARSLRLSNHKLRNATGWTPRFPSVHDDWAAVLREMRAL